MPHSCVYNLSRDFMFYDLSSFSIGIGCGLGRFVLEIEIEIGISGLA